MKRARLFGVFLLCCFSVLSLFSPRLLAGFDRTGRHEVASPMTFLAGQAKANPSLAGNQQANLYKEVIAHKGAIKWRPAPPPGIPTDVCVVFKACTNDKTGPKLATLTPATDAGHPVETA